VAIHHVAVAVNDMAATHRFYTEAMGFRLAKVEVAPVPEGGWARHCFYDTGGGMIAFWDLHSERIGPFDPAISTGLGLPTWTNHLAFDAPDLDALEAARERWLARGLDVAEIDHGWCRSVYTTDPNGIMVEFCCTTRPLGPDDEREAATLLAADAPEPKPAPPVRFHRAPAPTANREADRASVRDITAV
jgi:catechol 2,3-dioxygenase-like lactoylglutathione lyase family enzyme